MELGIEMLKKMMLLTVVLCGFIFEVQVLYGVEGIKRLINDACDSNIGPQEFLNTVTEKKKGYFKCLSKRYNNFGCVSRRR
jgi:hypothetical protein